MYNAQRTLQIRQLTGSHNSQQDSSTNCFVVLFNFGMSPPPINKLSELETFFFGQQTNTFPDQNEIYCNLLTLMLLLFLCVRFLRGCSYILIGECIFRILTLYIINILSCLLYCLSISIYTDIFLLEIQRKFLESLSCVST